MERNLREIGVPRPLPRKGIRPEGNSAGISCLRMPTRGRQTRLGLGSGLIAPPPSLHFSIDPLPPTIFRSLSPPSPLFQSNSFPSLPRFSGFRARMLSRINRSQRWARNKRRGKDSDSTSKDVKLQETTFECKRRD